MRYLILLPTITFILIACESEDIGDEYLKDPVSVMASTDVQEATIGDKIRYVITIISHPEIQVETPQFGENLGGFAIKDFGREKPRKYKGKLIQKQWYVLDTYVTGTYNIPAPVVKYTGSDGAEAQASGNEVSLVVKSVIPDSENPEDIKDIAEPVELPVDYTPYILIGVVFIILAGGGIAAYILIRRRKKTGGVEPPKPAHEIAYEQLQQIAEAGLIESGEIERYYVLLSAVVRYYLENRFGLHAPEMTTEEFLQKAASESQLKDEHKTLLGRFLTECDLVKFARYGPHKDQMKTAFESAKRFVDETHIEMMEMQVENQS
jgi:hypothetical protein